jgi:hypothetical protein
MATTGGSAGNLIFTTKHRHSIWPYRCAFFVLNLTFRLVRRRWSGPADYASLFPIAGPADIDRLMVDEGLRVFLFLQLNLPDGMATFVLHSFCGSNRVQYLN